MTLPAPDKNQQCLESIIEHWVDARIDAPIQIIAKYDEAAKQLITIYAGSGSQDDQAKKAIARKVVNPFLPVLTTAA
jgi:hypothetical protein